MDSLWIPRNLLVKTHASAISISNYMWCSFREKQFYPRCWRYRARLCQVKNTKHSSFYHPSYRIHLTSTWRLLPNEIANARNLTEGDKALFRSLIQFSGFFSFQFSFSLFFLYRYANGDSVEKWLNHLLCLDASIVPRISSGCPLPDDCDLYPFLQQFHAKRPFLKFNPIRVLVLISL